MWKLKPSGAVIRNLIGWAGKVRSDVRMRIVRRWERRIMHPWVDILGLDYMRDGSANGPRVEEAAWNE